MSGLDLKDMSDALLAGKEKAACACRHFDRCECANMRMGRIDGFRSGEEWDPCDCACHNDYDDEMDALDAGDFYP